MNKFILIIIFYSLSFVNCDVNYNINGDYKYVKYDIRGVWESNIEGFWPEGQTVTTTKGEVVFSYNTITITGPAAHFQGFTRNTTLEAYTEEGCLYIKDKGVWQSPVAYTRWEAGGSYPKDIMLTLQGGGAADETFKLISE